MAVLERSAGVFHWTPEGKRLFDYTSGVLVANLGHNPTAWLARFRELLGWERPITRDGPTGFTPAVAMTAYNAITPLEARATSKLLDFVRARPGGSRYEQVLWAASGSEAIQKALWACLAFYKSRPIILATRHGFHGKKGLALAITGTEHDAERDPRVKFVSFPMHECGDVSDRDRPFDPSGIRAELAALWHSYGAKIGTLVTEPYLGGGGSYHPPAAYLQELQRFCRERDVTFILDEVQSNFGRTNSMFASEAYGIEPDLAVLGKGLGNGVPVAAIVGRRDILMSLGYGEASDTWSANPISSAAVLATLEAFEERDHLAPMHRRSRRLEAGLIELKCYPMIAAVRGERDGMVWGIEFRDWQGHAAKLWANAFVRAAYDGEGEAADGVHLLGPLAGKVVRIAPPIVIDDGEIDAAQSILDRAAASLTRSPALPEVG